MTNLLARKTARQSGFELLSANPKDVAMAISASDFPGDEQVAEEIISLLYEVYRDDAKMAFMTFSRGSVLMQDAQCVTDDMIDGGLSRAAV